MGIMLPSNKIRFCLIGCRVSGTDGSANHSARGLSMEIGIHNSTQVRSPAAVVVLVLVAKLQTKGQTRKGAP